MKDSGFRLPVTSHRPITLLGLLGDPARLDRVALTERLRSVDPDLWRHAGAVAAYVDATTKLFPDSEGSACGRVVDAAWLHDIGKLTMQREALSRPGPLSSEEWTEMREHPPRGAEYLEMSAALRDAAPLVRQHHEWHDGNGYPGALRGDEIELGARLIGVADAYDAMTSWRPYRSTLSDDDAVAELRRCAGTQFDPDIVERFIRASDGLRAGTAR